VSKVVHVNFGGRATPTRAAPTEQHDDASPDAAGIVVYGLDACSTCDKARKWLDREQLAHCFVDYRKQPIPGDTLKAWAKTLGWEKLVNRASMTWRGLPVERKSPASNAEWLLLVRDHPALIRRPLVALPDGRVSVGFTDKLFAGLFKQGNP
jgi:Spx/MgsR family transcriptional regulator